MVQVYAENELIFDPNLEGYELLTLSTTVGVNKAGTATIVMPASHFAYNRFISQKTVVTIYQDDALLFRGRVLYMADDWNLNRTLTCEGERCFFCDSVLEPYLYQTDPASIFSDLVRRHNEQVDSFKQFQVGAVTVQDPNGYVRLESESAEQISDVLDKLVERVGGYVTFTTNSNGQRTINWVASLDRESGQTIEFGENLLDYSSTGANTDLATVIYPYGAKDETTGQYVTIEEVNNGKKYIQDDEAVALRGRIAKIFTWDDVTQANNLLRKAKQQLAQSKMLVTTLGLSAVDLSAMDKSIDALRVGDRVRVKSEPHGVNDVYLLTERTYNLLDPSQDRVVLGKDYASLTGADVAGDKRILEQIKSTKQGIKTDYNIRIADAVNVAIKEVAPVEEDEPVVRYSTENLLHNGDFRVNQRGQTSYKVKGYTVDRWRTMTNAATVTVTGSGVTLEAGVALRQYIEGDASGLLTAAVCDGKGNIYCASGNLADGAIKGSKMQVAKDDNGQAYFLLYEGNTFRWAALYRGRYNKETLPDFAPADYALELLECQRYYIKVKSFHVAGQMLTTGGRFGFTLPTEMRITPTLTLKDAGTIICNGTKDVTVTGATLNSMVGNRVQIYTTHATQSGWSLQTGTWVSGFFELSADL